MYLNPDLFERVDTHVDTVVRLIDGTEYVVTEPAEEIVRRIVDLRARVIAIAGMMQSGAAAWATPDTDAASPRPVGELPSPPASGPPEVAGDASEDDEP